MYVEMRTTNLDIDRYMIKPLLPALKLPYSGKDGLGVGQQFVSIQPRNQGRRAKRGKVLGALADLDLGRELGAHAGLVPSLGHN